MSGRVDDVSGDDDRVEFIFEDDGRITAVDSETGVATYGSTKAEALRQLADALDSRDDALASDDAEIPPSDAPWL